MANQRKLVVRLTDLGGRCRARQAQNAVEGTGKKTDKKAALQDKLAAARDREGASERQYFPCTLIEAKKYNLPVNVVVAIHSRGLDIVERKKKKMLDKAVVLISLPYQRILKWGHNKKSFVISTQEVPAARSYNFTTKEGEQIMEAIVSNVNGIMSKRKMQEEAVQTEDGYMTTEEVQAQLLLVKDDIDFIRKGLEKERLTREQGIEELNDVMHKLRDAFNCTPKRICDEMVKVHSGFERLKEMQQEVLDSETGSDHWREMVSIVPSLPVRTEVEIASNKLYDLTQDSRVIVIREQKDTKGNTRGRIKHDGQFGWTTIVDVDGNTGLSDTGKVLDANGVQRAMRSSRGLSATAPEAGAGAGSGRFSLTKLDKIKKQVDEDETEEDFMLSMGIGGGEEASPAPAVRKKRASSARKKSVGGGDDVIEGVAEPEDTGGTVFVMPSAEEMGAEEEAVEPEADAAQQLGGVDVDGDGVVDVDVDALVETLEAVVREALGSDDEDALDLENIVIELEKRLQVPSGFLREEFDDIIDDEVMRIIEEEDDEPTDED